MIDNIISQLESYATERTYYNRFADLLIDQYQHSEKPEDLIDLMFGTEEWDGLAQEGDLDFVVETMYKLHKKHKLTADHKERLLPILKQVLSEEGPLNDDSEDIKKLAMTIMVDLGILCIGKFMNGQVILTETEPK
jgi:hypothetical protein